MYAAIAGALVAAEAKAQTEEEQVKQIIIEEADKHGLDSTLLLSLARVESSFNPRARGAIGEVGLFQLRPEFHGAGASFCPEENTRAAAAYLAKLKKLPACKQYGRYWYVCYNRGPNRRPLTNPAKFDYAVKVEAARRQHERSLAHQD